MELIYENEENEIKVYQYSPKCVSLHSTKEWGTSNSKNLLALKGKYNKNLKIDEEKIPGWIFTNENKSPLLEFIEKGEFSSDMEVKKYEKKSRNEEISKDVSKKIIKNFEELIDEMSKNFEEKFDKMGKNLGDKIDKIAKNLGERIDKIDEEVENISKNLNKLVKLHKNSEK